MDEKILIKIEKNRKKSEKIGKNRKKKWVTEGVQKQIPINCQFSEKFWSKFF